jgi:uncharacterized protein YjbK
MTEWIETELKLGIPDESAWNWVRARLGPGHVLEQTNHFFDQPNRALGMERIGVRLREETAETGPPKRMLTIKGDRDPIGAPFVTRRLELESPLSSAAFDRAIREGLHLDEWIEHWRRTTSVDGSDHRALARLLDILETSAGTGPLERYAGFTNRRETLRFERVDRAGRLEMELELDRTEYPGGRVDFEIEVERTSERDGSMERTHRALVEWLESESGIRPFPVESKLARLNAILANTQT